MTPQNALILGLIHLISGLFIGASDLNDDYYNKTKYHYKLTTKLHTPKNSSSH